VEEGRITRDTARHLHSKVWVQHDSKLVVYYVPEYTEYAVYQLTFLPLRVGPNNACVRLGKEPYIAPVGMDGQFFRHGYEDCMTDADSGICSPNRIIIRNRPVTWVERLVVGNFRKLPQPCVRDLKLILSAIYRNFFRVSSNMYIYSPTECAGLQQRLKLSEGTTVVNTTSCTLSTSELIIMGLDNVMDVIRVSASDIISAVIGLDSV
jgi:hypothetical protein